VDDKTHRGVIFVAPVLPADVIATARALEAAGILQCLITRAVLKSGMQRLLQRSKITERFSRRAQSPVSRTKAEWTADWLFYLSKTITGSSARAGDVSFGYVDRRAASFIGAKTRAVVAREDCCLRTFQNMKSRNGVTIYQLPTAYWTLVRKLLSTEIEQFPGICSAAEDPYEFETGRTERKTNELELANYVLCPSKFVQASLPRCGSNVQIIPFAIDVQQEPARKDRESVFLYAGNITMRKGVHRLLRAWKKLRAYRTCELRLVGDKFLSKQFLDGFRGMFTHVPRVSREELMRHYQESSVFVFNSMADGFGQVILEAMAAGVAVIASRNSGAPDIIQTGRNGLLIDYGSNDQLENALDQALSKPSEVAQMGRAGFETAKLRTWDDYGKELLDWLEPILH